MTFINDNLEGLGITAVPEDKTKHTTLRYNFAKHSLIIVTVITFEPNSKH